MDNLISQSVYLITGSIGTISLPVLSKVPTRQLAPVSLKISKVLLLVAAPIFIVLWIFPKDIIDLTLGAKWTDGAVILQLIMIAAFINITVSPISSLFAIRNKPHQLFIWNLLLLLGNAISLIVGSRHGLLTAVISYCAVNVVLRMVLQLMTNKLLGVKPFYFLSVYIEYLKLWLPLVIICLIAKLFISGYWLILPLVIIVLIYYYLIKHFYPFVIKEGKIAFINLFKKHRN
jgi:O-antigen/teichoic acid export membrane protein